MEDWNRNKNLILESYLKIVGVFEVDTFLSLVGNTPLDMTKHRFFGLGRFAHTKTKKGS